MSDRALFNSLSVVHQVDGLLRSLHEDIDNLNGEELLAANVDDLVSSFADKYALALPKLHEADIHTYEPEEQTFDVSARAPSSGERRRPVFRKGTRITIAVPFDGDRGLFHWQPSRSYMGGVVGVLHDSEVQFVQQGTVLDAARVRHEFDAWLMQLKDCLGWLAADLAGWDERVRTGARQQIEQRRAKLLADKGIGASLGFPIKRRAGAPATYKAPEVRRKIVPKLPAAGAKFEPEPELDSAEYEHILGVISGMVHVMERSPTAFHNMDEETIRTHFLVQLNADYEGQATGETFNGHGKTDILVRSKDRNVFIAECKFWGGPAKLTETIDQLLGYLTWRDAKTAIIIFNRKRDFSKVLAAIPPTVEAHPNFRKAVGKKGDSQFRYLFRHRDDAAKDIHVAVLAFDIPQPA